ncbi:hypothetical protein CS390_04545 [Pseudomonas sp. HLS-6]|nr:hypothetical protein CS390_04545 [Pseudomonas sp. HLS-6]
MTIDLGNVIYYYDAVSVAGMLNNDKLISKIIVQPVTAFIPATLYVINATKSMQRSIIGGLEHYVPLRTLTDAGELFWNLCPDYIRAMSTSYYRRLLTCIECLVPGCGSKTIALGIRNRTTHFGSNVWQMNETRKILPRGM